MFRNIVKEFKDFGYCINFLVFAYLALIFILVMWAIIAYDQITKGNSLEIFKLGNVPIPSFLGTSASNLEVFIFCIIGSIAILIAVLRRYLSLRKDIDFLRKHNLKPRDLNEAQKNQINEMLDD